MPKPRCRLSLSAWRFPRRATRRGAGPLLAAVLALAGPLDAQETVIRVAADRVLDSISRTMTGACLEDVNHEVYGGLYSQMVYGESFQEPPQSTPPAGFQAYGGDWAVTDGVLLADGDDGPKLISATPAFATGAVGVEVWLADRSPGNAGLIVKVSAPAVGADRFSGYEVSLDAQRKVLVLGRHRQNWEHLSDTPCSVPTGQWIHLVVRLTERALAVEVDGRPVVRYEDTDHPLVSGQVGVRPWRRPARFRRLWVEAGGPRRDLPFRPAAADTGAVSRMWRPMRRGSATGRFALETTRVFTGRQSQAMSFTGGTGEVGLENAGLNRWGMSFVAGKPYEGFLWARADAPTPVWVGLESGDGSRRYATRRLRLEAGKWQRLSFRLTPTATDPHGRLAVTLRQPGAVVLGQAFLQPGPWGRFRGLPVRKDVTQGLIAQGLTVLRYGGSMVNAPEYRWKKMIGPPDRRPPYRGTWYPYASNGWGIIDFLNFCEAAGFLPIPAFNLDETPQDLADFVEYVNGPADSLWGRRRVADGHPQPYHLRHLEMGNEERVDENYWRRFRPIAEAIWAKDPTVIPVVGDFCYGRPIADPDHFSGACSGITSLATHRQILALAKEHQAEVWFDIHLGTEDPGDLGTVRVAPSFVTALETINPGARFKVAVFELNAGNHQLRRALANAYAITALERLGDRVPVVCSANCLQPDGQNDNGWDQGLLFLTPSQVWAQPPYYVTQMIARNHAPLRVQSDLAGPADSLSVTAKRTTDGKVLVLEVVNLATHTVAARLQLQGFSPTRPEATVSELSGPLRAFNPPTDPHRVTPHTRPWACRWSPEGVTYRFPPSSFTVLRFE